MQLSLKARVNLHKYVNDQSRRELNAVGDGTRIRRVCIGNLLLGAIKHVIPVDLHRSPPTPRDDVRDADAMRHTSTLALDVAVALLSPCRLP